MLDNNGILRRPISIGDVADVLNISASDVGDVCRSNRINMYSPYKPMRWGNPCGLVDASTGQDIRHSLRYGLLGSNSDVDMKLSITGYQNPYWTYAQPRGASYNEWYRLLDFEGYDHSALAPVKVFNINDTLPLTGGGFTLDMTNVFVPSNTNHLYITLDLLPNAYASESEYFGVAVWNKTRRVGYYLTTKYTLRQVVNQTFDSYSSITIGFDGISEFEGGDECELFYCCSSTCTEDEQLGTIDWVKARFDTDVQLIAPDVSHGHAFFTLVGFNLMSNLGFVWVTSRLPEVSSSYNTQQARYEVTYLTIKNIQCTYDNWRSDGTDAVKVYFRATVDGQTLGTTTMYLNISNASQWVSQFSISGTAPIDEDIMRSDDPTVAIKIYVRQDGQSTEYLLGGFTYDVLRQEVSYP